LVDRTWKTLTEARQKDAHAENALSQIEREVKGYGADYLYRLCVADNETPWPEVCDACSTSL
jgi:uncharacterized phage-associated protein